MSVEVPSLTSRLFNLNNHNLAVQRLQQQAISRKRTSQSMSSGFLDDTKVDRSITSAFIANFKGPATPLEICTPVIMGKENHPEIEEALADMDSHDPSVVTKRVNLFIHRWGRVVPIPPDQFFKNILQKRGYSEEFVPALSPEIRRPPTIKQLQDYDNEIVWAIRNSDLKKLETLHRNGKCMSACNKFSESIVHMACRRSEKEIVQFLIDHDADFSILDDFGRTPLHDACWRPEPRFDIVTMILDVNCGLLRLADLRGSTPLKYVREEHWVQWCAYLFNQLEKYWPRNLLESTDSEHLAKRQRIDC
eukprot:gene3978-4255_t